MNSLKVLVDWLLETVGCPHPGPASAAALDELRNHGVPEPLIDVYGVVGSDIPGLLPDPHELATVALLPPEAVCRHTKTALRGSQPCPQGANHIGEATEKNAPSNRGDKKQEQGTARLRAYAANALNERNQMYQGHGHPGAATQYGQ